MAELIPFNFIWRSLSNLFTNIFSRHVTDEDIQEVRRYMKILNKQFESLKNNVDIIKLENMEIKYKMETMESQIKGSIFMLSIGIAIFLIMFLYKRINNGEAERLQLYYKNKILLENFRQISNEILTLQKDHLNCAKKIRKLKNKKSKLKETYLENSNNSYFLREMSSIEEETNTLKDRHEILETKIIEKHENMNAIYKMES